MALSITTHSTDDTQHKRHTALCIQHNNNQHNNTQRYETECLQYNDTKHNDTQHNNTITLSMMALNVKTLSNMIHHRAL